MIVSYHYRKMGETTYCRGLSPKPSIILIATVDIILSLISFLLCALALADLQHLSEIIERDISEITSETNEYPVQLGINQFTHVQGQVVLLLLFSLVALIMALGLLLSVRKDWYFPMKAWLVVSFLTVLLGLGSLALLIIATGQWSYLLLKGLILIRTYEIWIVYDFLRNSSHNSSIQRSDSTERLHNV